MFFISLPQRIRRAVAVIFDRYGISPLPCYFEGKCLFFLLEEHSWKCSFLSPLFVFFYFLGNQLYKLFALNTNKRDAENASLSASVSFQVKSNAKWQVSVCIITHRGCLLCSHLVALTQLGWNSIWPPSLQRCKAGDIHHICVESSCCCAWPGPQECWRTYCLY